MKLFLIRKPDGQLAASMSVTQPRKDPEVFEPQAFRPQVYKFAFSWDPATLIRNIKAVKADYDEEDPRTWPLVTADIIDERTLVNLPWASALGLPLGVAYSNELMNTMMRHLKDPYFLYRFSRSLSDAFCRYPMNFHSNGARRTTIQMDESAISKWQAWKKGARVAPYNSPKNVPRPEPKVVIPKAKLKTYTTPTAPATPATKAQSTKENASTASPSSAVSPAAAFDNIMKSFADRRASASTTDAELDTTKKQLANEKDRADKLAQQVTDLQKKNQGLQAKNDIDSAACVSKYEALTKTAQQAEAKVKKLEGEAKQYKVQLETARKEAREANERIVKVWEEMEKNDSMVTDNGKRKAENDRAGAGSKKAKVEG